MWWKIYYFKCYFFINDHIRFILNIRIFFL